MNFLSWLLGWIFTQPQVKTIDASIPATSKLIQVGKQLAPLVQQAIPIVTKAEPLLKEAADELQIIWPAIEIVLNEFAKHKASGAPSITAAANVHRSLKNWTDGQNAK